MKCFGGNEKDKWEVDRVILQLHMALDDEWEQVEQILSLKAVPEFKMLLAQMP